MANPSISVPDELLDEFDDTIEEMKVERELDIDMSRSEVLQQLMRDWIDEQVEEHDLDVGNPKAEPMTAD